MTRLPFGSTRVTTAATDTWICSERSMSPWPWVEEVEERSPRILAGWLDEDDDDPLLKP